MNLSPETLSSNGSTTPHDISPGTSDEPRFCLYGPEFAADPHRAYREMRARHGALVPVDLAPGVPATLVIDHQTAVRILHDETHFPADPRVWQQSIPADCPVRPILEWRPNAMRNSGTEHIRYRRANTAAIDDVDLHQLQETVERIAISLINGFCTTGTADLVAQYAFPLAFDAVNAMLGCPSEIGHRVTAATTAVFDGVDAEEGNRMLGAAIGELVELKRSRPGSDITSRLLQHPTRLNDDELCHQLVVLYGAGIEPLLNLVVNTVALMLTDVRFAGGVLDGSLSTRDALDEVLFNDPPMANFSVTYPRQPILIDQTWLPAHQPVVISLAGCNNDPAITSGERVGNRSHLAWGAGPHVCPARPAAYVIAQVAIDQLLDALPDLRLGLPRTQLTWRPGPFHRALAALPVTFPPTPPSAAASPWRPRQPE
ncbi:cytochrome P450 [Nocardia brasiliensis]|uniref:cytochrome P450 n=1 Tax=Nocardia brasiliensis TaxID=37326 RepID=UPI002454FCE9|nr:cytochrome P450 [Nocardia brasiliensis]